MSRPGLGFRVREHKGVVPVMSFCQPWPSAIFEGGKDLENRKQATAYRGPLWVHASSKIKPGYYEWAAGIIRKNAPSLVLPGPTELVFGAIVGLTWVTGCAHNSNSLLFSTGAVSRNVWAFDNQYGWQLDLTRTTRLTTTLPMRGHQGLWRLYEHEEAACLRSLPLSVCQAIREWKASA